MIPKSRGRAPQTASRVSAVLGPTNTGKTHYAIERLLAHKSGMIGLPLRLLAREVYDRIVKLKGAAACALITGEEKIVPAEARYFVCTVEAMPVDLGVAFLAVDEIQLCADPERGHVFTDRLLNARGDEETIFMGAESMRGAIQRFIPHAYFITRPRFSDLAYTGHKKLTRLPRRSAIVAFSADDVYGIADLVRRQRGGAAVVLGALSPRTRNAQLALYQSGDVDFLVATDAIGMGINMDVDHVAFSAMEKFDGMTMRPLRPEEIGQIAGRAGRHMNDGTFGVTGEAPPLDEETVARVEGHRYEPIRVLQYRNSALSFHSLQTLLETLDEQPPTRGLVKARPATDFASLRTLAHDEEIAAMATAPAAVKRLWEACQLPDFRKLSVEEHMKLVAQIYRFLMSDDGAIDEDWLARQIARVDVVGGDVATLSGRLAQIRTWTYATHRPGWVKDAAHWQDQTRAIEDRLSDALHETLTQRFIDRRTGVLMRSLRDEDAFNLKLHDSGAVSISGEMIGQLDGFRFTADAKAEGIHGRTLRAAALKGLDGALYAKTQKLALAPDADITLSEHGKLWWDGAVVGNLEAATSALSPRVAVHTDEQFKPELRAQIQKRLDDWLVQRIAVRLEPLIALRNAADAKPGTAQALPAEARGLAHQLCESLGSLDRKEATLPSDERAALRALRAFGVRFARRSIYMPKLIRPDAAALLALLWAVKNKLTQIPPPPQAGFTSFEPERETPRGFIAAAGFRIVGPRAIRIDMLDRLEQELEAAAVAGTTADAAIPKLVSLLGVDRETMDGVLAALGWNRIDVANAEEPRTVLRFAQPRSKKHQKHHQAKRREPEVTIRPDSPFAELAVLVRKR
jgi:ATP-dependent RNA helicase SUPV3L1/SUV3